MSYIPTQHISSSDPTVNDDIGDGFVVGSVWVTTTDGDMFVCQDNSSGAAVWKSVSSPMVFLGRHTESNNADGGTATSGGWQDYVFNEETNDLTEGLVDLNTSTGVITLTKGYAYFFRVAILFRAVDSCKIHLLDTTESETYPGGTGYLYSSENMADSIYLMTVVDLRDETVSDHDVKVQYQVETTASGNGLGEACNFSTEEVYGHVLVKVLREL